jgi:hypothetical protein
MTGYATGGLRELEGGEALTSLGGGGGATTRAVQPASGQGGPTTGWRVYRTVGFYFWGYDNNMD